MSIFLDNSLFSKDKIELIKTYLQDSKVIALDIETSRKYPKNRYREDVYKPGLDPYMSRIVMIQIGDENSKFIIDTRKYDSNVIRDSLKDLLENKEILKVGHNLKFEGKFFLQEYQIRLVNVWDTMIADKVLYNGVVQSYSLEALMDRYLGIKAKHKINLFAEILKVSNQYESSMFHDYDEEEILQQAEDNILNQSYIDKSIRLGFLDIGDKPFTKEQLEYGESDITAPLEIYKIQVAGREDWNPIIGLKLENAFTQVLAEAELQGIPFDSTRWIAAYDIAFKSYRDRELILNQYVQSNYPKFTNGVNLFSNELSCAIKWSSSKQVIDFFKSLSIAPKEKSPSTKRMEYTVGAKTLFRVLPNELKGNFYKGLDVEIVSNDTLILQYLLFKKSEQLVTTFGKEWLKYVHPITFKVHTNYNQYMISSRLSSSNPNLQQIPGLRAYRDCFTSKCLINADFASQELRIAAEVHQVEKMMDFFKLGDEFFGEDLHSFNATQMFKVIHRDPDYIVPPKEFADGSKNKDFTKQHGKERDVAKSLGFKLQYGGSAYTLALDLGIDEDAAEIYMDNYFAGLPGMKESFEIKKKDAVKRGWVELDSYSKKRYFFPEFEKMNNLYSEVNKLYPENYKEMSQEEKLECRTNLKLTTNYSELWREYWILRGKLERRSLNLPIQGAAATMTKLAGLLLYKYRWENGIQDVFQVPIYCHDEILAVILDDKSEDYAKVIEDKMAESGKFLLKQVPMKAGAKISTVWEH